MEIKIYTDILFLINLIFDFCLLSVTSALIHIKPNLIKLIISSATGAFYSVMVFFTSSLILSNYMLQIAVAATMVSIAFGIKKIKTFLKYLCIFYLTSLAAGGMCFALFSSSGLGSRFGAVYSNGILYINISVHKLIFAAAILHIVLRTAVCAGEKFALKASKIKSVTLSAFGNNLTLPGLCDSGNFLSDSETGLGVCVAEWTAVKNCFPDYDTVFEVAENKPEIFKKITCKGIGGTQELYAFYAELGYSFSSATSKRLIAITPQKLTSDQKYFLILPNDFEGDNINDGTSFKRHFMHSKNQVSAN
ncbi:MAG: sigma-E processing peptidase SpoIIGA [Clostridia bacterium]|nr:sigma-E processing peptidase SpoIIGA [Clostridia bacterium]